MREINICQSITQVSIVHCFTIYYDAKTLTLSKLESKLIGIEEFRAIEPASCSELGGFFWGEHDPIELAPGQVKACWMPGRMAFTERGGEETLAEFSAYDFPIYHECMDLIFQKKYPDAK